MKKIVFLLFIIVVFSSAVLKDRTILIPENAIRIRVIANSDNIHDQEIKSKVKNEVNYYLYSKLRNIDNYNEAKSIIKNSYLELNNVIDKYTNNYTLSYDSNYFPEKEYKNTKYKEGNYESVVITLGKGEGNNFWCVLFPPLCLIDEENLSNAEYKLYVNELLKKIK